MYKFYKLLIITLFSFITYLPLAFASDYNITAIIAPEIAKYEGAVWRVNNKLLDTEVKPLNAEYVSQWINSGSILQLPQHGFYGIEFIDLSSVIKNPSCKRPAFQTVFVRKDALTSTSGDYVCTQQQQDKYIPDNSITVILFPQKAINMGAKYKVIGMDFDSGWQMTNQKISIKSAGSYYITYKDVGGDCEKVPPVKVIKVEEGQHKKWEGVYRGNNCK